MNKEIIKEARALLPFIVGALEKTNAVTEEQASAVTLISGIVADVVDVIEKIVDSGADLSDEDKKLAIDTAAAAAFAAKFKEDL